jgi:hypothetical protein
MDPQILSSDDKKNLHLTTQVCNEFLLPVSSLLYVLLVVAKCKSSHEICTKFEETFGGSIFPEVDFPSEDLSSPSHHEEIQVASSSSHVDCSMSFISHTCDKPPGNDMVGGEIICDDGNVALYNDSSSSIYKCSYVESLDLKTS